MILPSSPPVTNALPSRLGTVQSSPSCASRCLWPLSSRWTTPSASAKWGMSESHATATQWPSRSSGATVGILSSGRLARLEGALQPLGVEVAANEDKTAFMLLIVLPRSLMVALDDHMYALHDIAFRIILEGNDALQPQDVRAVHLGRFLNPGKELLRVHFAGA